MALADHEGGHVAIASQAAGEVTAILGGLSAPSVARLHHVADTVVRERLARARAEEVAYDVVTHHGATQGARLDGQEARRCA